ERTRNGVTVAEVEAKNFVREGFSKSGLFTDHGPIVGVNANAANPHYEPTEQISKPIRRGDFVLIDMWAKLNQPDSVYYDITWTASKRTMSVASCPGPVFRSSPESI